MYTEEQIKEYVDNKGYYCPNCKADNIEEKEVTQDYPITYMDVECKNCGAKWTAEYSIDSVRIPGVENAEDVLSKERIAEHVDDMKHLDKYGVEYTCIYCRSKNTYSGSDCDAFDSIEIVSGCYDCNKEWYDVFVLTGIYQTRFYFWVAETEEHDVELETIDAGSLEDAYKEFAEMHPEDIDNITSITSDATGVWELIGDLESQKDLKSKDKQKIVDS